MKHNDSFKIIPFLVALTVTMMTLVATGCNNTTGGHSANGISAEVTDTLYAPRYADGFVITASPDTSARLITTLSPWQGDAAAPTKLLLLDAGTQKPAGFDGQVLCGTPQRVVCMSSTHIAMLDALGLADRIVGVSSLPYITTPSIANRIEKPVDVGYEGSVNYEALAATHPDMVMLSAINGPSSMEGKLRELGIPFIYVGDYMEESPLGKVEWCIPLGEIFGVRDKASHLFDEIPQRYESLRKRVAALPDTVKRPAVMLNAPYGDAWFLPPTDSYSARLIIDAGGEVMWKNSSRSAQAIDLEEAYSMAQKADVWLNPGQAKSLADLRLMAPKVADTQVMQRGAVFNNNRRTNATGGNAYFEEGVMQPDEILADLIAILHPELLPERTVTIYYHRLK